MTPNFVRTARHRLTLTALLALAATPAAAQQATGRLEGHIRDQQGQPVPNAQVALVGTPLQAIADQQGFYFLNRVPAGTYRARVSYVAYRPIEIDSIVVHRDRTTTRDFVLQQTATDLQEITVVAAENRLVPRDQVTSKQLITGTYVDGVPVVRPGATGQFNTEAYNRIVDNPFLAAAVNPLSTFGVDVDRASYANVRRFITQGRAVPKDAVRIEELLNYFPYDNPAPSPESHDPFTVTTELAAAPWAPTHRLVRIALQSRRIDTRDLPPANLVFLLDVSGSMQSANKLPLVKTSLRMLVEQLRQQDRVAIVVYAGAAGLVLPPTSGGDKATILAAIDRLEAGGSTAGGAGLRLAYSVAREHLITGGNNRVILATDGDFNVGVSSDAEMERLVEGERQHGVFLTVLGFGMGNYKDSKLETLADKGNGNYAYIDTPLEARKTLVSEMGGTLFTVAKDVKLQVEFNPARVQGYRLLGYENRMLAERGLQR